MLSLSPAFAPFTLNPNTGLRAIAWLVSARNTGLPLSWAVIVWMKCSGTTFPAASLRCPVSIGCAISTRTSSRSPSSFARIFIGSAIAFPSAAAAADGDLHLLDGGEELAVGGGRHDPDVRRFAHLRAQRHERQRRALREVEGRDVRERVLLDQHHHRGRA